MRKDSVNEAALNICPGIKRYATRGNVASIDTGQSIWTQNPDWLWQFSSICAVQTETVGLACGHDPVPAACCIITGSHNQYQLTLAWFPLRNQPGNLLSNRSEERRVGKECRSRW